MVSTNQSGAGRDRETFPRIASDIGEDPARFLDREVVAGDGAHLVKARIRGIDSIETVRAWRAVERSLGRGPADGPREGVIRLLDQREDHLEERGERPERLEYGPRLPPDWFDTESAIPDRERTALDEVGSESRDVATDGGEDQ